MIRFELFLTRLPTRVDAIQAKEELAKLPRGINIGVIVKGLEKDKVPIVSVAYSDDKRIVNEIQDRLHALGARSVLVDHGSLLQKLKTWFSERMGAERYKDHRVDTRFIRLRGRSETESKASAFTRKALIYVLQTLLASALYVWHLGNQVGLGGLLSQPTLATELSACALGVLVAYVAAQCVEATQRGALNAKLTVVACAMAGISLLSAGALFVITLGGPGIKRPTLLVVRPPSNPYAGIIEELKRRKLVRELHGGAAPEPAAALGAEPGLERAETEILAEGTPLAEGRLTCVGTDLLLCTSGPFWEDVHACLPEPLADDELAYDVLAEAGTQTATQDLKPHKPQAASEFEPRHATAVAQAPQEFRLTVEVVHIAALFGAWLASILSVQLLYERRARRAATASNPRVTSQAELGQTQSVPDAADGMSPAMESAAAAPASASTSAREEGDGLREALARATTEGRNWAKAAKQAESSLDALRRELLEREGELSALRERLPEVTHLSSQQATEIQRLGHELERAHGELRLAKLMLAGADASSANVVPAPTPPPAATRAFGESFPRTTTHTERNTGYSVVANQEERVGARAKRNGPT